MTEDELKAELARLNREIPVYAATLDRMRERRDNLLALFPVPLPSAATKAASD